MQEFKIYQNGRYDTMANIKMKLKNKVSEQLPIICDKIDDFFVNH